MTALGRNARRSMHLATGLLAALAGGVGDAASLAQRETEHGPRWVMENDRVVLHIDAARGARVDQFRDRRFKHPAIREHLYQGLFIDHLAQQPWPGELWEREYAAEPVKIKGAEVVLTLSATVEGKFKTGTQPESRGVVIRKTYRLADGEAGVRVEHCLENPSAEARQVSLWVQNVQQLGEDPKQNVSVRPAAAGVYRFVMPQQPRGQAWSRYRDSIAGWSGVVDPASGHVLVYCQDFDYLDAHYNAGKAFTVEWFMAPISLPPGGHWRTASRVISRRMRTDVLGVTPHLWVGAHLSDDESKLVVNAGWEATAESATFDAVVRVIQESREVKVSATLRQGETVVKLPKGTRPPLFITGEARVPGHAPARFAEFLGGEHFPKNEPLPGYPPLYQVPIPERRPRFSRPDVIELAAGAAGRALLVSGPMTAHMRLHDLMTAAGLEVDRAYERFTGKETRLAGLPSMYDDLLRHGLVVLNNADTALLTPAQRQILPDYVRAGGVLLVFAGTSTAGANWSGAPLRSLLPATPSQAFVPAPMDLSAAGGAFTAFLPRRAYVVTWEAPAAATVTRVGKAALALRHPVGKGAVVTCGLSGMGTPVPSAYWRSNAWARLVSGLLGLCRGRRR